MARGRARCCIKWTEAPICQWQALRCGRILLTYGITDLDHTSALQTWIANVLTSRAHPTAFRDAFSVAGYAVRSCRVQLAHAVVGWHSGPYALMIARVCPGTYSRQTAAYPQPSQRTFAKAAHDSAKSNLRCESSTDCRSGLGLKMFRLPWVEQDECYDLTLYF
eukprot:6205115-Pleurochrysis_carterae.AAC.2